jgi:hypothetical protein
MEDPIEQSVRRLEKINRTLTIGVIVLGITVVIMLYFVVP